jgi:hypothetical protein
MDGVQKRHTEAISPASSATTRTDAPACRIEGSAVMNYHCPFCGELSDLVMNPEQAFCTNTAVGPDGNDICPVVMFNPSLPDGGLSETQQIKWEKREG